MAVDFENIFDTTIDGVEIKATLDESSVPPSLVVTVDYKGLVLFTHHVSAAEGEAIVERLADSLRPFIAKLGEDFYDWYRQAMLRMFPRVVTPAAPVEDPATSQPAIRVPAHLQSKLPAHVAARLGLTVEPVGKAPPAPPETAEPEPERAAAKAAARAEATVKTKPKVAKPTLPAKVVPKSAPKAARKR